MSSVLNPSLSTFGSDFNSSNISAPLRTIGAYFGDPGTGKTYTLLRELPEPVAYFWYDNRSQIELEKARNDGRKILDIPIVVPPETLSKAELKKECNKLWNDKVIPNLIWAARKSESGEIRSIAMDTATEATDIIKFSFDGTLKGDKYGAQGEYVNRQWLRVADIVRSHKANLILTTRESQIWTEASGNEWGKPTGMFKPRCPAGVIQAVDWSAHLRFKKNMMKRTLKEVEIEILKSGENRDAMTKVIGEEEWKDIGLTSFQYMMAYVFEKGSVDDWKP